MEKEKRFGQVFTPEYLVRDILDFVGYVPHGDILEKHVIDNSCGDGAFLVEVARRYAEAYFTRHGRNGGKTLARQLGTFVHGIEIDSESHAACLKRLDAFAAELGLPPVGWDVRNADALTVDAYDGKMDFVVGNPPYVRVHNLGGNFNRVKGHSFCTEGMTDLYLVFYEIGLGMLSPKRPAVLYRAEFVAQQRGGARDARKPSPHEEAVRHRRPSPLPAVQRNDLYGDCHAWEQPQR